MEETLFPHLPHSELLKFEKEYEEAENASNDITFNYAYALIHSEFSEDKYKGIGLLETLAQNDSANKRDYIYLLALGNTSIRRYDDAMKIEPTFLKIEPNNKQVVSLQEYIKKDTTKRVAITAGLLGLGGVIGLVVALMAK